MGDSSVPLKKNGSLRRSRFAASYHQDQDSASTVVTAQESLDGACNDAESQAVKAGLQVQFGGIEIYEFKRQIGDNPSVGRGPPISMETRHYLKREVSLDDFEKKRRNRRLTKEEMNVDAMDRLVILKAAGASMSDINDATNVARDEREKRIDSAKAYLKKRNITRSSKQQVLLIQKQQVGVKRFMSEIDKRWSGFMKKIQIPNPIQGQV
jgi:hypothetical protein